MKTKTRTLLAIGALGIIGFININAIADNKKAVNAEVVTVKEELLKTESMMADEAFFNSAEVLTAQEADMQIERYATKQILLHKNAIQSDFLTAAESLTVSGTDQEIEKYAVRQISKGKTKVGK